MYTFVKFFIVWGFVFIFPINTLNPSIEIIDYELDKPWTNDWDANLEKQQIVAKHRNELVLTITCTASYQIYFKVETPSIVDTPEKMRQCDRLSNWNETFHSITSSFHFLPNVTSAIAVVQCNQTDGSGSTNVNIFVPGEKALLNSGETLVYKNEWIPCLKTNPYVEVSLFKSLKKNGEKTEKVSTATYDVVKGFHFKTNVNSYFVCTASDNDTVKFLPSSEKNTEITRTDRSENVPPEIVIENSPEGKPWQEDWESIDVENSAINLVAKHSKELVLLLSCSAPYDIQWDEDFLNKRLTAVSKCDSFPELINGTLNYSRRLTLRWKNIFKLIVTLRCKPRKSSLPGSSINIFIPSRDNKRLVHSGEIMSFRSHYKQLPCHTTDPNTPVTLWHTDKETGSTEQVWNVTFDPSKGFLFDKDIIGGSYTCKTGESDVVRFVEVNSTDDASKPYAGFIIVSKQLESLCTPGDGALINNASANISNTQDRKNSISTKWLTIAKHKMEIMGSYANSNGVKLNSLNIYCIKSDKIFDSIVNNRSRLIRKWTVEVDFNSSKPKEHFESNQELYYVKKNRTEESFYALKWDSFLYDEFIFMLSEGERTFHTNTLSSFTCKTSHNVSGDLTFWMELSDGNVTQIFSDSSSSNVKSVENCQFRSWTLDITLPLQAVAIQCKIPSNVHRTLYLGAEKRFQTKDKQKPNITSSKSLFEFHDGQFNQKIQCFAEGEPKPIRYEWKKISCGNLSCLLLNSDSDPKVDAAVVGKKEESTLIFEKVNKSHAGTYLCNATNEMGSNIFYYTVNVDDDPEEVAARLYKLITILVFVIVVLCAASVSGFGIYRYYKAKALMRGLNEQELKEFFQGRIGAAKNVYDQGNFDLLPYDTKFEINPSDADLDYGCILGSGEFAIVIKGYIKSKELPAAVKISKTTADVTLFKALLSEVKILSYIGKHVNVTGLVGVNTTDIQNRNIYIYMDLCELGSLEKYLRANKQKFLNLIDENQQINTYFPLLNIAERQNSEETLNTLDLIRWAAEIATGMEYLACKSIVHADLAARNVLLSQDKTARVSDFGMSKKLYECNFYQKKTRCPLPWRWMALESLNTLTFSTESDVWSYGVTLWELFTLGDVPFPNEEWNKAFVDMLICGIRMGKPKFSPVDIFSKIGSCWDENPLNRPQFAILRKYFSDYMLSIVYDIPNEDCTPFKNFGCSTKRKTYMKRKTCFKRKTCTNTNRDTLRRCDSF